MKRLFKYASGLFLTGMLSVLAVASASAQRGASHGGGGGGIRAGGGGGFSGGFRSSGIGVSRPATGANVAVSSRSSAAVVAYRGRTGNYLGGTTGYHGGAFYRTGLGYYGYPHLGFYLGVLPFGYYPFYWGSSLYYYYGGVFYSPYDNGGYQVTEPPVGAGVPSLPDDAQPIKIDGVQYYELSGVYYKETVDDKGKKIYVVAGKDGVLNTGDSVTDPNADVAAPQVGDVVNQLPDDCRKVTLNGKKYYVSPNNIYYEKVTGPDGNTAYRIASLPNDDKGI
ncbi:hypothetical protein KXD93_07735 [Mucilaginibacter sp. BJC16-A38]|uniref:DUF6515 family protein n=1 Tax=Mucilaginibacter phenanthrenivorans TaxID=1234842 RepID=UPI0021575917|nr:DUF6515 family protein [Mucilaginibacter phenanthrenivorans]MCR8557527.1 hypothetical protein [Mucilaginibacter phenanthrenivorans]